MIGILKLPFSYESVNKIEGYRDYYDYGWWEGYCSYYSHGWWTDDSSAVSHQVKTRLLNSHIKEVNSIEIWINWLIRVLKVENLKNP